MYDLSGKVALVTGAGGEHGFGRAIAIRLAQEGADVIVNDILENPYPDRHSTWGGAQSVVAEIEALGRKAISVVADVSDSAQVNRMVRQGSTVLATLTSLSITPGRDMGLTSCQWSIWKKQFGI